MLLKIVFDVSEHWQNESCQLLDGRLLEDISLSDQLIYMKGFDREYVLKEFHQNLEDDKPLYIDNISYETVHLRKIIAYRKNFDYLCAGMTARLFCELSENMPLKDYFLFKMVTDTKDITEVFIRAKNKYVFTDKAHFIQRMDQIIASHSGLILDYDDGAGENWAVIVHKNKGKVCMIHTKIGIVFLKKDGDLFLGKVFDDLFDNLYVELTEDFSTEQWHIDLARLIQEVPEIDWHSNENTVNRNRFSLDDLYFATV